MLLPTWIQPNWISKVANYPCFVPCLLIQLFAIGTQFDAINMYLTLKKRICNLLKLLNAHPTNPGPALHPTSVCNTPPPLMDPSCLHLNQTPGKVGLHHPMHPIKNLPTKHIYANTFRFICKCPIIFSIFKYKNTKTVTMIVFADDFVIFFENIQILQISNRDVFSNYIRTTARRNLFLI